jgi:magnesium transporter
MAGEVTLTDWWRVMREILSGFMLSAILGLIGFLFSFAWHLLMIRGVFKDIYKSHWDAIGLSVSFSLVGVVCGNPDREHVAGHSKKLGADPASSSAPFIATRLTLPVSSFILRSSIFMKNILF